MITLRQWYHAALTAPLVVPGAAYLVAPDSEITMYMLIPLFFGGASYGIFALWAIWYYRKATTRQLFWFSWKAPFYYLPVCYFGLLAYILVMGATENHSPKDDMVTAGGVAMACIPVGYMYVILTHCITWALKKAHMLKEEPDVAPSS